mmetsp:Transcript_14781/g.27867  ORF Transcript_14781/g.27867 Transcript_14781/m.27867 type:complete len:293 (-) Transcript_14781:322-1200(-)
MPPFGRSVCRKTGRTRICNRSVALFHLSCGAYRSSPREYRSSPRERSSSRERRSEHAAQAVDAECPVVGWVPGEEIDFAGELLRIEGARVSCSEAGLRYTAGSLSQEHLRRTNLAHLCLWSVEGAPDSSVEAGRWAAGGPLPAHFWRTDLGNFSSWSPNGWRVCRHHGILSPTRENAMHPVSFRIWIPSLEKAFDQSPVPALSLACLHFAVGTNWNVQIHDPRMKSRIVRSAKDSEHCLTSLPSSRTNLGSRLQTVPFQVSAYTLLPGFAAMEFRRGISPSWWERETYSIHA